jgi:O-antigen/teichoic acid export membrane protein
VSQVILFLTLPIIASNFNTVEYGKFAGLNGVVWIGVVLITFQLEHLVILDLNKFSKYYFDKMVLIIFFIFVSLFLSALLSSIFFTEEFDLDYIAILTSVVFLGINQFVVANLVKERETSMIGHISLLNSISFVVFVVITIYFNKTSSFYLFCAQTFSYVIGFIFYFVKFQKARVLWSRCFYRFNRRDFLHVWDVYYKVRSKVVQLLISNFLKTFWARSVPYFLANSTPRMLFFSGSFALGERLISTPMGILGNAIAQVLKKDFADLSPKERYNLFIKISKIFSLFLMPSFLLVYFCVDYFVFSIFPKEYQNSTLIIKILYIGEYFYLFYLATSDFRIFYPKLSRRTWNYIGAILILAGLFILGYIEDDFFSFIFGLVILRVVFVTLESFFLFKNLITENEC